MNKTIFKPRVAAATCMCTTTCTWDFPDVIRFCIAAHTISEKAIRLRHPDYNPDRAQKLISSSISRHLSTRNISYKSMQVFLSNLALRQRDRQKDRQMNVGKNIYLLLCLVTVVIRISIVNKQRAHYKRYHFFRGYKFFPTTECTKSHPTSAT